ncbi:Hypothetical predicted protein [Paramuricea clavata]|uniref:Uncharacterized protein n=1 Tax=Paramuricea clavata TaxID=317549 RepID=A0A6S7FMX6_PARCT|nr:Hypothetical predicted protein [Paramuricea clavata]
MSEVDLDDAIASILADSDEDTASKKKKHSSKRKSSKLSSKALTSSVNDEDFYKNLSKISEEQSNEKQVGIRM